LAADVTTNKGADDMADIRICFEQEPTREQLRHMKFCADKLGATSKGTVYQFSLEDKGLADIFVEEFRLRRGCKVKRGLAVTESGRRAS
jgi:hypothetical protein